MKSSSRSIAYEGLRYEWKGRSPYATGDPLAYQWGPKTDLGLYGSSYVGLLGGIIRTSNVPGILQLNCLATDFFHDRAYPTYLYYNPHPRAREVRLETGPGRSDLYDAVTHRFLRRNVSGLAGFSLPADHAAVVVVTPAQGRLTRQSRKLVVDGVVVDYAARQETEATPPAPVEVQPTPSARGTVPTSARLKPAGSIWTAS